MRQFSLTLFPAPKTRPGGDPDASDGVVWPTTGRPWVGELDALARLLTTPTAASGKYTCPYFVAGILRDGLRLNQNVEVASVVGLDVDNGVTTQAAHGRFLDCFHIIYTSWSHQREAHRFRLVVPLARDVDPRVYRLLWQVLSQRIPGSVDPRTRDVARALFLPAIRPDGVRAAAKAWEAPLLDPDALLGDALKLVPPATLTRRPCPPVRLPPELAQEVASRRLATHPEVRLRAAEHLQAVIRERRAEHIRCPKCGRPSVWFWIDPHPMRTARCNHRNSCGWWGRLEFLLDAAGGVHE